MVTPTSGQYYDAADGYFSNRAWVAEYVRTYGGEVSWVGEAGAQFPIRRVGAGMGRMVGEPFADFTSPKSQGPTDAARRIEEVVMENECGVRRLWLPRVLEETATALKERGHLRVWFGRRAEASPLLALRSPRRNVLTKRADLRRALKSHIAFVTTTGANGPRAVASSVADFESLRLLSWWQQDKIGSLHKSIRSPVFSSFLSGAVSRLAHEDKAFVASAVAPDGTLLSASIYLIEGNSALLALRASDKRPLSTRGLPSLSIGSALDTFAIDYLRERGLDYLHLGRGDESYKFRLGAEDLPRFPLIVTRRRSS